MSPYMYSPLLTDLYQLTMAYGYWKLKRHEQRATFHLLFRKNPFKGNYALAAGLAQVVDFLKHWRFQEDDLSYLASLKSADNHPLFPTAFLDYLKKLKFTCHLDAIPEGTVVFPHAPLLRIEGPILQCQLLEAPLLNIINFQTLIATKASRVCLAAGNDPVIEFGMRRAQGPDGALSASRASYIGGCVATSNTLAGKLFDIPVRGTHAHSWVTAFESELQAFDAYATVMPHNGILLVDTYNTIEGVKNAIITGKKLRANGTELIAIRLDSGDMTDLSKKARKLLDDAGFKKTGILASNSLDEYAISKFKEGGAKISSWGVGTHLVTAFDQPALDGVYKLSSLCNDKGDWEYKLKISEDSIKTSNPGRHQVRRYFGNGQYLADVIYDLSLDISDSPDIALVEKNMPNVHIGDYDASVDLLEPIFRNGKYVQEAKSIHDIRKEAIDETKHFVEAFGKKVYAVGLEKQLADMKSSLVKTFKQATK